MTADEWRGRIEPVQGMLKIAMADCRRSYHEFAIANRFAEGREFFRAGQHFAGLYRRTGALECHFVRIYQAQMADSEVAHGACNRADIQRVAHIHKHHS